MEQTRVGQFITKKRKEKNLTQEQLAERLNVSNKTVSKWECGKCMPDYSLVEALCKELDISIGELLEGKEYEKDTQATQNDQLMKLVKDIEQLKKEKVIPRLYVSALILVVIGIALSFLSTIFGGSNVEDFISGFLIGIAIVLILISIFLIVYSIFTAIIKKNRRL